MGKHIIIGYARVSTYRQLHNGTSLKDQVHQLKKNGCSKVFYGQYTGTKRHRPQWDQCYKSLIAFSHVEPTTLMVVKIDRLGRNMKDIVNIVDDLTDHDIKVQVLTPSLMTIDNKTTTGKMWLGMMSTFSDVEHQMIIDRLNEGKSYALSSRGKSALGGRPHRLQGNPKKIKHYVMIYVTYHNKKYLKATNPKRYNQLYNEPIYKITSDLTGVSVPTVYKVVGMFKSLSQDQLSHYIKRYSTIKLQK